ncbi:MAG: hypothetical protein Q8N30_14520 [Methylococcales bacterium]|nr:hypothetical protein [Methylococcales bacterium]
MSKWKFTPCYLPEWNNSEERVLFVAAEPNGQNPHSGILDMGHWFKTAAPENKYYTNSQFYTRCKIILDGINGNQKGFNNFRFMDLKATQGGAEASQDIVLNYVKDNIIEVVKYFNSTDQSFGLSPHIIVLLGNTAQSVFVKCIKPEIKNTKIKWVGMPHPSHTVGYEGLQYASKHIKKNLKLLNEPAKKWVYKKDNFDNWVNI